MFNYKSRKVSLMPAVALAALSALIAIPALSQARLYAAAPEHFATVTVRPGDNLWSIAGRYTHGDQSVQDTIDRILALNRLSNSTIAPGQKLVIPR